MLSWRDVRDGFGLTYVRASRIQYGTEGCGDSLPIGDEPATLKEKSIGDVQDLQHADASPGQPKIHNHHISPQSENMTTLPKRGIRVTVAKKGGERGALVGSKPLECIFPRDSDESTPRSRGAM